MAPRTVLSHRVPLRTALVLAAMLVAGCRLDASFQDPSEQNAVYHGFVLEEPLPKPDFTLPDTDAQPFDFGRETEGKLALVFVGYTYCPDVCPIHMANLAAVLDDLPKMAEQTRVIFITADPKRDTPERLRAWLDAFDSRFVGLRGSLEDVHRIEDALKLPHSVLSDTTAAEYDVGHSALVLAFSPDGPARVVYPFGTRQADYAHDLPRLLVDDWTDQ